MVRVNSPVPDIDFWSGGVCTQFRHIMHTSYCKSQDLSLLRWEEAKWGQVLTFCWVSFPDCNGNNVDADRWDKRYWFGTRWDNQNTSYRYFDKLHLQNQETIFRFQRTKHDVALHCLATLCFPITFKPSTRHWTSLPHFKLAVHPCMPNLALEKRTKDPTAARIMTDLKPPNIGVGRSDRRKIYRPNYQLPRTNRQRQRQAVSQAKRALGSSGSRYCTSKPLRFEM